MCRRFSSAIESTYCWQYSYFRKLFKKLREHDFAVDAIVETGLPDFYGAGDIVEILPKREISVAPRDELFIRYRLKAMLPYDRVPHGRFVRHVGC
jgi:hypothetical protein